MISCFCARDLVSMRARLRKPIRGEMLKQRRGTDAASLLLVPPYHSPSHTAVDDNHSSCAATRKRKQDAQPKTGLAVHPSFAHPSRKNKGAARVGHPI
jgi:hypothetical protein